MRHCRAISKKETYDSHKVDELLVAIPRVFIKPEKWDHMTMTIYTILVAMRCSVAARFKICRLYLLVPVTLYWFHAQRSTDQTLSFPPSSPVSRPRPSSLFFPSLFLQSHSPTLSLFLTPSLIPSLFLSLLLSQRFSFALFRPLLPPSCYYLVFDHSPYALPYSLALTHDMPVVAKCSMLHPTLVSLRAPLSQPRRK